MLVLVAVSVQTLPVRVCAVEQAVAGGNCHDEHRDRSGVEGRADAVAGSLDGHAGSTGDHDAGCLCEMPKGELDRHVPAAVPVDLVPVVAVPSDLQLVLAYDRSLPPVDRPPDVGRVGLTLPLLN
jgi:hypothetical protein